MWHRALDARWRYAEDRALEPRWGYAEASSAGGALKVCGGIIGSGDVLQVSESGGGTDVSSSGDAMHACRRGDVEVSSTWETCCRCRGVEEAQRYRVLEMRCRRVDVEILEVWSAGGALRSCRSGAYRCGTLEV